MTRRNIVLYLSWLFFASAVAPVEVQAQPNGLALAVGSVLGQVFIHESGHGVLALATGYRVEAFKPFPHICGGKFVAGCVEVGGRYGSGIIPGLGAKGKQATMSAAGSMFSVLGAAAVAPMLPKIRNTTNRLLLDQMVTLQIADWPFYCVADLLGFQGDWSNVSRLTGVSLWFILPLAVSEFVVLSRYHRGYRKAAVERFPEDYEDEKSALRTLGMTVLKVGF